MSNKNLETLTYSEGFLTLDSVVWVFYNWATVRDTTDELSVYTLSGSQVLSSSFSVKSHYVNNDRFSSSPQSLSIVTSGRSLLGSRRGFPFSSISPSSPPSIRSFSLVVHVSVLRPCLVPWPYHSRVPCRSPVPLRGPLSLAFLRPLSRVSVTTEHT